MVRVGQQPALGPHLAHARGRQLQAQQLAARVGARHALHQHASGRGELAEQLGQAGMQALGREALGPHRGAEQVAVLPEYLAVRLEADFLAVVHRGENAGSAQRRRQALARFGEPLGRRALDADQHEARSDAVAQLLHQQLLHRGGRARQERREVGRERGARDDQPARDEQREPRAERPARRARHGASRRIVITE